MTVLPVASQAHAWRTLEAGEAQFAFALHRQVLQLVPPGTARQDNLDYFTRHIDMQGRIVGCFDQGQLVTYGVLGLDSPMLGAMAEWLGTDIQSRARLCLLDGAACAPASRGHGLHVQAIALRIEIARQMGKSLVAATVAPTNLASLRGLLRQGFVIRQYAVVYGGLARLLLVRDLHAQTPAWQHHLQVASGDLQGHCAALQQGLTGYDCLQDAEQAWGIAYGRQAAC